MAVRKVGDVEDIRKEMSLFTAAGNVDLGHHYVNQHRNSPELRKWNCSATHCALRGLYVRAPQRQLHEKWNQLIRLSTDELAKNIRYPYRMKFYKDLQRNERKWIKLEIVKQTSQTNAICLFP